MADSIESSVSGPLAVLYPIICTKLSLCIVFPQSSMTGQPVITISPHDHHLLFFFGENLSFDDINQLFPRLHSRLRLNYYAYCDSLPHRVMRLPYHVIAHRSNR